MNVFATHEQAVHVAKAFFDTLMVERELTEEDLVDEELLGKVIRGEDTPEVELDEFGDLQVAETGAGPVRGPAKTTVKIKETLTRRDLLRGNFLQES